MSFTRLLEGPEQSRSSNIFIGITGIILGGLAALLGTVTHSGGIDGGTTGVLVALLTVLLGSVAFMLLAGAAGWASFGFGVLGTMALSSAYSDGDAIGAVNEYLSHWWLYGSPAAIILGGLLAWIGYSIVGRD